MSAVIMPYYEKVKVDPERLLNFVSEIGRQLMLCGAEVYRVEDSMEHIFAAYGYYQFEVFAIPACIVMSVVDNGRNYTKTVRIKTSNTNMELLCSLNDLSRKVCDNLPDLSDAEIELKKLLQCKLYTVKISYLGYGAAAAFFTLFFGGGLIDALIAFFAGFLIRGLTHYLKKVKANVFFLYLFASMILALYGSLIQILSIPIMFDKVMIGGIMLLVPGVAITNVFRDLIAGDFVTAVSKLFEVLIISFAIAIGIALPISVIQYLGNVF